MFRMPFPDRAGLDVVFPAECVRMDAVAVIEYVVSHYLCKRVELTSFFGFGKVSELGRKVPQRHNHESGAVFSRTSGQAGHTFSAIPYRIALEQGFDFLVLTPLDSIDYLPGIISVEFSSGTYCRAGAAVYAGLQTFLHAIILAEHII